MEDARRVPGAAILVVADRTPDRLMGHSLSLGYTTVLGQALRRARRAEISPLVAVVSTYQEESPSLARCCQAEGVKLLNYPDTTLPEGLAKAAATFEATLAVVLSAQNPLSDPRLTWATARYAADTKFDLVAVSRIPLGGAGFTVRADVLRRIAAVWRRPTSSEEIVSLFVSGKICGDYALLPPPPRLTAPHLRFRLESDEDYLFLSRVFREVTPRPDGLLHLDDAVAHQRESVTDQADRIVEELLRAA